MRSLFLIALLPALLVALKPLYPDQMAHLSIEDMMAARNGEWTEDHTERLTLLKKRASEDAAQIAGIKNNNKAIKAAQKALQIDWNSVDFDELEDELKSQLV